MTTKSLFDSRGVFVPLADNDMHSMTAAERDAYQGVHVAYSEVAATERKIELATRRLRDTVAELRGAERAVAAMPSVSRIDLCRELAAQTAGRA